MSRDKDLEKNSELYIWKKPGHKARDQREPTNLRLGLGGARNSNSVFGSFQI